MRDPLMTPGNRAQRPPELALLLACARWPQTDSDRELTRVLSAKIQDWPHFLLLAQHHRLVPLVSHSLQVSLGDSVNPEQRIQLDTLGQLASANTYRTLRSLAELRRVVQTLQSHNISVRVLKGIPLAQSIFGDFSLRASGDLDLLIDAASILEADSVLRRNGYSGLYQIDRFTPRQIAFYKAHWKDVSYRNSDTGFEIDLHWRCFRNCAMPGSALCAAGLAATVSFGSFQVDTLPAMETLLYLCVHGTLDGWLYLKSLADVSAQLRQMDTGQLDSLAGLAQSYGVLPELSAASILVRRYFGMSDWSAQLLSESDPTVRHILRFADRSLEGGGFLADRAATRAGTMMAFEFGLRHTFQYRMEILLRVLFRARMWETIPLPDVLFWLYPLLSPLEWVIFRVRRWLTKTPSSAILSI